MPAPRPMKLSEIQQWIKTNRATVSVGTFLLNGTEHRAVICTDGHRTLALCPWQYCHLPPAVYTQSWDWDGGYYDTEFVCLMSECRDWDTDALYSAIKGECPRCHGAGVIEAQTRYGAFMVPDLLPCPECQRQESEPPLPF
jgi:hypothetical protein